MYSPMSQDELLEVELGLIVQIACVLLDGQIASVKLS